MELTEKILSARAGPQAIGTEDGNIDGSGLCIEAVGNAQAGGRDLDGGSVF